MTGTAATVRAAREALARAGVESPDAEARALVAAALRTEVADVAVRALRDDDVDADAARRLGRLVADRAAGAPLQHVVGRAPFRHLDLPVGPGVLVPRPETGLLVDLVAADLDALAAPLLVDLFAGSGAVALAVVHEHPHVRAVAVERERDAADWLRRAARERAAAGDRPVTPVQADVAGLLRARPALRGAADVVTANPPYVRRDLLAGLPAEVRRDPRAALDGGPDGLAGVRLAAGCAAGLLRPGGLLALEHAEDQVEDVARVLRGAGFGDVAAHDDATGRPRASSARRPPPPGARR